MKIMTKHSSATERFEKPHGSRTTLDFSQTTERNADGPRAEKVEALAEIICGAGDEPAGALLVLMGAIQNSADPKALANTVKHFAFTRCGELNLFGIVDAQIAVIEGELL